MLKQTISLCLLFGLIQNLPAQNNPNENFSTSQSQNEERIVIYDEYDAVVYDAKITIEGVDQVFYTNAEGFVNIPKQYLGKRFEINTEGYETFVGILEAPFAYTIHMAEINQLDEIVVIGYGDSAQKKLTTSITKVKSDDVSQRNITSANQMLQGQVAGVNLTVSNGTPGARSRVNIRGVSSINGDNEPLYVIDGVPISKSDASYNYSGEFVQEPLSLINPSDIESMDV